MQYNVIVIGSGPGGYVAAIRAAQLGLKIAIIERYNTLGGTCLNVGCIPSKALLDSSEHYHNAVEKFATHGIITGKLKVDMEQMIRRKDEVVAQTSGGIDYLMKKNKIDTYYGHGSFVDKNTVSIKGNDGKTTEITGEKIVIATGSKPITPAAFNYDKKRVITSTEALHIKSVPKKMVIIGAGVIGLEMGSVFARLGTEIDVIEFEDRILTGMDKDCAKDLQKALKALGFKFHLGHAVTEVKSNSKQATVSFKAKDSEEVIQIEADYCLIAIGRRAFTDNLGLENVGIEKDDKGRVKVNHHLETNVAGIYAIGDVIQGAMLAHKASEEGVFVAEVMAGQKPHINYNLIPGVVYTWPEMSSVGQTEEQLKSQGVPLKVGKFPFKVLGRARASLDLEGLVKIIAHKDTDEILGIHMVGARAADLIAAGVTAMEFRAAAEDIARMSHAHPTFAEAIKEAALAVNNAALHV